MKKAITFLALLLLFCSSTAFSQSAGMLTGVLQDDKQQPVSFGNVAVLDAATSAVVTGAIADMDGKFQIQSPVPGKYMLKITGLGYIETKSAVFEIKDAAFSKDFGTLLVKPDVKTLSEVKVETLRPTVITHPDKLVVSVENTAMASGSTAYDVLAKSPGVWIDQDGNLQLNGKAGVQVMLNGKRSYLTGKELQNLLQNMTAENIKDLEIITNPSARHDAEGSSGIININLKKAQLAGMSGSVYGTYQYNNLHTYSAGTELNHKSGKWNSFGTVDVASRRRYRDMSMDRVFTNPNGTTSDFMQDGYEENERLQPTLRLGTTYDLNASHSIGAMANLIFGASTNHFSTQSNLLKPDPSENEFIVSENAADGAYFNGTFNLNYTGKLDTLGTTLTADLDYVHITNQDDFEFKNRIVPATGPVRNPLFLSENPVGYDIYSLKTDYTRSLTKDIKLELGAKASHVKSDNELRFYNTADGQKIPDEDRSNHFIYKENILAAYTSLSVNLGKRWSVQGGLRAEYTSNKGESVGKEDRNNPDYLNLFPTVFVQQKLNDNYQIGYKYSRRINRPNYQNLNPFIFYLDPYTSAQGNPDLKPMYVHSFEMTHTLKQTYNLILGYAITKDFIAEVPSQDPETNTTVFKTMNVDDLKSANATLVAPIKVSKQWEISNNIIGMYQEFTYNTPENKVLKNDQFTMIAQSNHSVLLPHGLKLEVGGGYQTPAIYALYKLDDQWWVDAGLKKSFMDDKLALALNFTDIFRSRVMHIETHLNGNTQSMDQYHGARSVRFNVRYRFSKGEKFQAKKRSVNLDELNRAGGNQ